MKLRLSELRRVIREEVAGTELELPGTAPKDTEWPTLEQMARMHPDELLRLSKACPNRLWAKTASLIAQALRENPAVKSGDTLAKKNQAGYINQAKIAWKQFQETAEDHDKRAAQTIAKHRELGHGDQKVKVGGASSHMHMSDTYHSTGARKPGSPWK